MVERIVCAAVKIKDRYFTSSSHSYCVEEAKRDGFIDAGEAAEIISNINRLGLFKTNTDRYIDRKTAYKEFGISQSNQIPFQRTKHEA